MNLHEISEHIRNKLSELELVMTYVRSSNRPAEDKEYELNLMADRHDDLTTTWNVLNNGDFS